MNPVLSLALTLAWYRTRGSTMVLSLIFGLTPGVLSLWLRFGRKLLVKGLLKHEGARVRRPSNETIFELVEAVHNKYAALPDVWGAMDGLKLYFEAADDLDEQSMYFNGWKSDHYINSLFLFSPDGRICHAYFNAPGSLHDDSTMAEWGKCFFEKVIPIA